MILPGRRKREKQNMFLRPRRKRMTETSATGTGIIYSTGFAVWNSLHPGYGKFILSPGGISPNG